MGLALERSTRWFIAEGTGIDRHLVIEGNSPGARPKEGYASLLLVDDRRKSYPIRQQLPAGDGVADLVYRRAMFSLQFYREDAVDLAEKFDRWAMSEVGLSQAETAFSTGQIDRVRVVRGGSGYTSQPAVGFDGAGGSEAAGEAYMAGGTVRRVRLLNRGKGFVDTPNITFTGGGGGAGAAAVAYGLGFRVVFPLTIRRLDEVVGDKYERRSQIDLALDYPSWWVQPERDTGFIDTVEGDYTISEPRSDPPSEDGRVELHSEIDFTTP